MATFDELMQRARAAYAAGDIAQAKTLGAQAKTIRDSSPGFSSQPRALPQDATIPALPQETPVADFSAQIAGLMSPNVPVAGVAPAPSATEAPSPKPAPLAGPGFERFGRSNPGSLSDQIAVQRIIEEAMAPKAPAAAPVMDESTWRGDLEAGWNTLKTVIPGWRAAGAGEKISDAIAGRRSDGGLEAEAVALEAEASAVEESAAQIEDANDRAFALEQAQQLRDRAAQRRLFAGTPTQGAAQKELDAAAADAVPDFIAAIQEIGRLNKATAAIPMNPAAQKMDAAGSFGEALGAFGDDPAGVLRTFGLRTLPVSAPSAIGAIAGSLAGPAGAAVLGGLVGGSVEMGSSIADGVSRSLQAAGVDPADGAAVAAWAEANPKEFMRIVSDAQTRALTIGAVDAVTGGAGGAIAKVAQGAGKAGRVGLTAAGGAVEAAGEGAGEALAQVNTGQDVQPGEIAAEIIGGAAVGGPTTAGQMAVEALKRPSTPTDKIAAAMVPPAADALAVAPKPEAAPAQPSVPARPTVPEPMDQIAAAMGASPPKPAAGPGKPITRAEAEANPDRYEIVDESEGQGADWRATGAQVAVDRTTGRAIPLAPETAAVPPPAAAGAPGGVDSAGKPQAAPVQGSGDVPAAAGAATKAAVVADAGGDAPIGAAPPAKRPNQPDNIEFITAAGVQAIGTEPDVMQYKAGGDADGVTDRLKGVTEWRPERAGMSIIYEYADGRRVIADGHQRLGLAKRLAGQGKAIQMPAMILRQADGVSPEEARVTAALKNIAEGSGTALDAAKVLRGTDKTPAQLDLPPNSAIVRDATGMRALSDQAFGMVVNGVASERDGGIVGRVVTDQAAQANILALLARMQKDRPITAFQAEQVAKQAAADTVTETQDSLFGPEMDTKNLYLERAKILEAANRMARDEKRAFTNVLDNADRLQAAGNQLDADGNKARVDNATTISDYLGREANTKGAISEALTAAARALNGGATLASATRQFLNAVESGLGARRGERTDGDPGRQEAGSNRPAESGDQGLTPDSRDETAAAGDLFAAPSQTGKHTDQVRAEAEAKVRADQSKIRKAGGNDGDAGPLFDTQGDLLAAPKSPRQPVSGEELIQKGRGVLLAYSNADDGSFDADSGTDLRNEPAGRELAAQLLAAKSPEKKQAIADKWVLKQGKATGNEHLVVLDKEGVPLAIMMGGPSRVSAHAAVFRAAEDGIVGYATHNHPQSTSHSGADMAMLYAGFSPLSVVAHDGTTFTLTAAAGVKMPWGGRRGPRGIADVSGLGSAFSDISAAAAKAANAAVNGMSTIPHSQKPDFWKQAVKRLVPAILDRMGVAGYDGAAESLDWLGAQGFDFEGIYGQVSGNGRDGLRRAGLVIPEDGNRGRDQAPGIGSQAAPSKPDRADRKPQDNGGRSRVTGNSDLDGALDDIFGGEGDVSGTGNDLERPGGDGASADGVGAGNVPASAGGTDRKPGRRGKAADGGNGQRGADGGLPDGDAAAVGTGGDPGADGAGGADRQPAAGGNGGRRNGGGDGRLSSQPGRKADAAGNASASTGKLTPAERLAAIRGILKEDTLDFVAGPERRDNEARAFAASLKAELGLRDLSMYVSGGGDLRLNMIAVPRDQQGNGIGTEAMRQIVDFANERGMRITLSVGQPDDGFGTTSRARLVRFYKRFGFVENTGRNKDFELPPGMYRNPRVGSFMEEAAPALDPHKAEALESIFVDALEGVDPAKFTDRQIFASIMLPLRDAGMTRAEIADLTPYLEAFLADLRAGRVNLNPEAEPQQSAIDRLNAVLPGWSGVNGMLTNPDPERGGIIDKVFARKKWFVILNGSTASVEDLESQDAAVDWFLANFDKAAKAKAPAKIIPADRANIDATLPLLLPVQRDDVFKVETRFAKPNGHGMLITNGTGTGKAQPLDAGILTPQGWRKMGDMAVGDLVISADGTATEVVGVYPQGEKPIYRVVFSDGAVTECCDEHLWETQTLYARRKGRANPEWACAQPRVRSLAEIRATLDAGHFVPVSAPVDHPAKVLPVRPYTLGVILGDGCLRGGAITISGQDEQIAEEIAADVGDGFVLARVRETRCPTWRISDSAQESRLANGKFAKHRMVAALRDMGLMGVDSAAKFIPADYLTSSIADRLHLLQGLMDTDGTVDRRTGSVSFCTVAQGLADGVTALVRSLGGIATRTMARKFFTHKGERLEGRLANIITIHLPNGIAPFRLSRKVALLREKAHAPRRKIVAVSLIGTKPAQCIAVAHPRHLYVTDDYVLTHNTYSGGGVIKRFVLQGKSNVLIVAPSDAVIDGWVKTMDALGVPVYRLGDTKDAGQGVVITTYANIRTNDALATRDWDLVVTDEAQNLMQNAQGDATTELDTFRAITHRPADLSRKSRMTHADDWARYKAMPKGEAKDRAYRSMKEREDREVAAWMAKPRPKALFLSATPFAYDKTVDYAEGYLFDYPEDGRINGSNQSGRNLFFVRNFGYRIRYHKLTKPEHAVDSAVFEREFHEAMKRQGVLSGRSLQVDVDYDRRFVKKEDGDGTRLDEALELLGNLARAERETDCAEVKAGRVGRKPQPFSALQSHMAKNFDYLARQQLLEAIKAKLAVDEIKAHLALGRKVVVFHDFNVGGGLNPFTHLKTKKVGVDEETGEDIRQPVSPMTSEAAEGYRNLLALHPWIKDLNFAGYKPPIKALPEVLGSTVRLFNGKVPEKKRLENLAAFNTDGSGVDVLVVQADAGGAGISMHDVTGNQQRVMINLGMPVKPTTTLQQEGRIRRVGSKTDAIFRYFTIGTVWERIAFAQRIAERSGTVENLALGNEARDLMNAFIDAYMEASDFAPSAADGTGGAAKDNRGHNITPFQRAVSHYFGRPKISGRRDQRDGVDFYPTAEPLAYKMVEWAGLRANERVLEPSAGDGAILRYMPDDVALHFVEPSSDLRATSQLRAPKGVSHETTFEQHHISNKYHAIVMNPPFGQGGATAIAHLAKAARHLRDGGRIVALIPTGPSADKRFDAWWEGDDAKGLHMSAEVSLPAVAFERAGTGVMTRVVIIDKPAKGQTLPPDTQRLNFTGATTIQQFFDRLEGYDVRRRPDPVVDVVEELEAEGQDAGTPAPAQRPGPPVGGDVQFKLDQTTHGKTGEPLFVAAITNRVEREVYTAVLAIAKQSGGWYSSFRGNGAKPGFQFKSETAREAFLADMQKPTATGFMEESPTDYQSPPQLVREAAVATEEIRRLLPALRAELDRLDLKRVRLTQSEGRPSYQGAFVVTGDGEMEIVIGASLDPMKTLHHEVIHALRAMNLFTPAEWQALTLAAERNWLAKHDIEARYPHLTAEEQVEEAIAEEFTEALAKREAPKGSLLIQAFNKIARAFRAIRNVMQGAGYQTPEDIFGRVLAGEIGLRQAGNTGARVGMQEQARIVDWSKQVLDLFRGKAMPQMMDLGDVPPVIRRLGGVGRRMVLSTGKAKTISKTHPDLTAAAWLKLPELIRNPEIIIDNSDGQRSGDLLVITSEQVDDGRHVVVAVNRNGRDDMNAPATVVVTVFPKDRLSDTLAKAEREGRFLYVKAEREGDGYKRIGADSRNASPVGDTISRLRADSKILTQPDIFKPVSGFKEQRPPLAVRPLTPQARAHRNSGMGATPFIPDRRVWETLTRAGIPIWQRLRDLPGAASDAVDRARYTIQDRMLPFLRAQEAVMRQTGRPLPKEHDAYLSETTFSGKVGRHLLEIDEEYTKPIIQIIAASKGKMDVESVGTWLYARHAIERNAYIASINPNMPDGGSGMLDAEAQQILGDVANSPDAAQYDRIGALIDQLRERNLRLREDAGLISQTDANLWRAQYKHYVPLKGFEETDHYESMMDLRGVGIGRRFSNRGPESRRALGRASEAFNPLQSAITQAQEVAIRAEKNRVAVAMYELAANYPSAALWEVKAPKQKRYFNRTTGLVESRVENPATMVLDPNEMAVKIDGKEHRILFNDQRLAESAGTLGADQMQALTSFMSRFSRYFSMVNTMLSPAFVIANAIRDFATAQIMMAGLNKSVGGIFTLTPKQRAAIMWSMTKNWRKAMLGAMRGQSYRFDTEWSRYYKEFQKAGAQVSFWTLEQPESARDDLERRIRLARGNAAQRALKHMSPSAFFSTRDNPILSQIERVNLAVDNAIRLAAFVEARKQGLTADQASFLSKELTVNFNRRGKYGAAMNAYFPFFNAAVQGTTRLLQGLANPALLAGVTIGGVGLGLVMDLVNAALSDEDDDGELLYDKIPDYRNARNLHIHSGTGSTAWAIPLPYGFNIFPYAGQQIGKVMRGVKDADEAFGDVMAATVQAYLPTDTLVPTILQPTVEVWKNENFFGVSIYPEDFFGNNKYLPDAAKFYPSASEASKAIAMGLNKATGGNELESGLIDVSPEVLDHYASFVVGGAGRFWGNGIDVLAKVLQGKTGDIETKDIPFVSVVRSEVSPWIDRYRFKRFSAEVRNARHDLLKAASSTSAPSLNYPGAGKAYGVAMGGINPKAKPLADLYEQLKKADSEIAGEGEFRQGSRNFLRLPRDERTVMLEFNKAFLEVAGKQGE